MTNNPQPPGNGNGKGNGGVTIGNVMGGIRDSIIAGGDVVIKKIFVGTQSEQRDRRNQESLLNKVRSFWIEGVLEKSLHGAALIDLDLATPAHGDALPWDMVVRQPDQTDASVPPDVTILDLFDQHDKSLLILGQPGSGKTTMLLTLARSLLARADNDAHEPIPVVLNLSSWGQKQQPLGDWIVEELGQKYNIPHTVAYAWVENDTLLYLLDGLDEVHLAHRNDCVDAINDFQEQRATVGHLVVCSRTADYEALDSRLNVPCVVLLQPLTYGQVSAYLDALGRPELRALSEAIKDDHELQALFETPLMLSMVNLTYQGANSAKWRELTTTESPQKHLFGTYVESMFNREVRTKRADIPYTDEQTTGWLSWLATKMIEHSATPFLIETMQPNWTSAPQLVRYLYISRLIQALIIGLLGGLAFGLVMDMRFMFPLRLDRAWLSNISLFIDGNLFINLIQGLMLGILIGLTVGLIIATIDVLRIYGSAATPSLLRASHEQMRMPIRMPFLSAALRRSRFAAGLIRGGVSGLIGSVMGGWLGNVVNPDPDQPFRYASALIYGLGYGLVFGIEGYRQNPDEDIRTTEALDPQWGRLLPSLIAGLLTGLLVGLAAGMLLEVTGALLTGDLSGAVFQRSLARGLFYALGVGITFGLSAAVLGYIEAALLVRRQISRRDHR